MVKSTRYKGSRCLNGTYPKIIRQRVNKVSFRDTLIIGFVAIFLFFLSQINFGDKLI